MVGKDFASEAAQYLLRYGFEQLHLNRIYAYHRVRNPASGKVLQKIGIRYGGADAPTCTKVRIFEDVVLDARLHEEWLAS